MFSTDYPHWDFDHPEYAFKVPIDPALQAGDDEGQRDRVVRPEMNQAAAADRPRREPVRHVVCRADEIAPGAARRVEIEGREIAIFNVNGEFSAIGDRCPHEGASLCRGQIMGLAQSRRAGPLADHPRGRVRALPLAWLGVRSQDRPLPGAIRRAPASRATDVAVTGSAELQEGPYRIDIYEVSQEGDYVVRLGLSRPR